MSTIAQSMRRAIRRGGAADVSVVADTTPVEQVESLGETAPVVEIAPNDPLVSYLQTAGGAVEVEKLELDSPAVAALREAGVALLVPLVSGGELIGTLNLGPRLSDQQYSTDDKKLLDSLAAQAAPALQVAELVRKQASAAAERERIDQELKVATLIQQNFLPRELPDLPGWQVAAYYQPAREVGGDFYDFFRLDDGRVAVVIGDVTDKGVPAAMVMAAARSVLRASGSADRLARRGARAGQRPPRPGHPREHVRHLPLRGGRPGQRGASCSRTRATTCRTRAQPRGPSSSARRDAARDDARHDLRGERGRARTGRRRCSSTATASPRRTTPTARCTARPGWSSTSPTRVGRPHRRSPHARCSGSREATGSRRTTSRSSRSAARSRAGPRTAASPGSTSGSRYRARPATSARRCSASSTRSSRSGSKPVASSGSRPPCPRPR